MVSEFDQSSHDDSRHERSSWIGFRTSFRTWTQEKTNYPREIAETALAHALKDKAEAAYARSDLLEKRTEMMEAWAKFLSASDSDVIQIRV